MTAQRGHVAHRHTHFGVRASSGVLRVSRKMGASGLRNARDDVVCRQTSVPRNSHNVYAVAEFPEVVKIGGDIGFFPELAVVFVPQNEVKADGGGDCVRAVSPGVFRNFADFVPARIRHDVFLSPRRADRTAPLISVSVSRPPCPLAGR